MQHRSAVVLQQAPVRKVAAQHMAAQLLWCLASPQQLQAACAWHAERQGCDAVRMLGGSCCEQHFCPSALTSCCMIHAPLVRVSHSNMYHTVRSKTCKLADPAQQEKRSRRHVIHRSARPCDKQTHTLGTMQSGWQKHKPFPGKHQHTQKKMDVGFGCVPGI